jgi:hypothetical protein
MLRRNMVQASNRMKGSNSRIAKTKPGHGIYVSETAIDKVCIRFLREVSKIRKITGGNTTPLVTSSTRY